MCSKIVKFEIPHLREDERIHPGERTFMCIFLISDSAALACKIKLTADVNRLMFGFTVSRSKVVERVLETTDSSHATYEIAIKLSRICLVYNLILFLFVYTFYSVE